MQMKKGKHVVGVDREQVDILLKAGYKHHVEGDAEHIEEGADLEPVLQQDEERAMEVTLEKAPQNENVEENLKKLTEWIDVDGNFVALDDVTYKALTADQKKQYVKDEKALTHAKKK